MQSSAGVISSSTSIQKSSSFNAPLNGTNESNAINNLNSVGSNSSEMSVTSTMNSSSNSSSNYTASMPNSSSFNAISASNSSLPVNVMANSASSASVASTSLVADIQAQFEMSVELRRFINIDLFQRGYYQIRVSVKVGNKQALSKISVQLEPNKNNCNLSDSMFPSCIYDEYGVSKTFLILYRNEEIILDDQIIFKISTLVNAFNLVESFEKLDLQLNVELWFTENDYKPLAVTLLNIASAIAQASQANGSASAQVNALSYSGSGNLNTSSGNANDSANSNGSQGAAASANNNNNNGMQQLCCRTFKVHFDPRQGIHVQMPVLFDYFHLSAVSVTVHCTLLTLLPPVMFGSNLRNSTLATILFGKDLSQFKSTLEITTALMKRAVHLHNQICSALLMSYEYLQDHIFKMSHHLTEYERKNLKIEYVNCKDKLNKLNQIVQNCSDPETLDDLANRHVAQCSAENIMQWCIYLDNFTMNQSIAPFLAIEYHNKRLKRFSESFFTKDLPRKSLQEYEMSDNYVGLNDYIRQSPYFLQIPDLAVACDDLDGTPENLPIIFEESYIQNSLNASPSSNSISSHITQLSQPIGPDQFSTASKTEKAKLSVFKLNNKSGQQLPQSTRKSSVSSNEFSTSSNSNSQGQTTTTTMLSDNSNQLHRKLKKKLNKATEDSLFASTDNSSITLVSYRKVNDYFSSDSNHLSLASNNNSSGSNSEDTNEYNNRKQKHYLHTQMSSPALTANAASSKSTNGGKYLHSITESIATTNNASSTPTISSASTSLFRRSLHLRSSKKYSLQHQSSFNAGSTGASNGQANSMPQSASDASSLSTNDNGYLNQQRLNSEEITDSSSSQALAQPGEIADGQYQSLPNLPNRPRLPSAQENNDDKENNNNSTLNVNEVEVSFNSGKEDTDSIQLQMRTPEKPSESSPIETVGNDPQQPIDCSSKSRALYESFRGKVNTLERPRRARRSLNGLINNTTSVSSAEDALAQQVKSTKINGVNSKCGSLNTSAVSAGGAGDAKGESLAVEALGTSGAISSVVSTISDARSHHAHHQVAPVKAKLKKQLTINTDRNSLSSLIVNESLFKFVMSKEELKKVLINRKYAGNIYSEYMMVFCLNAPYFYQELTPKLAELDVLSKSKNSGQEADDDEFSRHDRRRSSSFLMQSKSKILKLFGKSSNEDGAHDASMSSNSSKKKTKTSAKKKGAKSKKNTSQRRYYDDENDNDEDFDDEEEADEGDEDDDDDYEDDDVENSNDDRDEKLHLVVCVHGLDGNSGDLRLVRTYIELALPGAKIDFLMSEHNQENTFDDIEVMTLQLIKEITDYIDAFGINPERISFIGHSLGNLIVRSTVAHEKFKPFVHKLHTYLSLSGPHLGTLYNSSGLINMGMWIMQKWKKSGSLLQLSLKDNSDLTKTFLYKLSTKPTFEYFRHILLVASPQDRYVPFHSARIDMCKAANKDNMYGQIYREMLKNILKPIQESDRIQTFKRFSVFHTLPSGTSNFIGRAAHIAVLDSELFVEKLVLVSVAKYFR